MEKLSYSAHISNKKSAINSKAKLAGVAKHNLRKYHSSGYSNENIKLIYGTDNLMRDVKQVYKEQFGEAVKVYNAKQTRPDRKIKNYFNEVSEKSQDMAVEIIFQIGDKKFWEENCEKEQLIMAQAMYEMMLSQLMEMLPDFVVANAVVHFDEASPHMHVVGVPVGRGFKRGLETKVSKRSVFTQETLANILQGELRELAESNTEMFFDVGFKEKQKGKNHDLSVVEYKVAKETEKQKELEFENTVLEIEKVKLDKEFQKTSEKLQEVRAIASMGEDEMNALENAISIGPAEPTGMMSARAYRDKVVKPFLSKILGMTKLVIARAKSCFAELIRVQSELETVKEERDTLKWECKNLQDRNEYVNGLYERMDKENDRLREENRELGFFRKYLSRDEYEKIVERGEREHKKSR